MKPMTIIHDYDGILAEQARITIQKIRWAWMTEDGSNKQKLIKILSDVLAETIESIAAEESQETRLIMKALQTELELELVKVKRCT